MTIVKNPYRYRDHQRWPEGKKTAPNRADVGRWQKTSFTTKKLDAAILQKIRAADCC